MNHEINPFTWPVRVYYEDTDAGGVVYYAQYLKFLERARTEWVRSLGIEQERLYQETGLRFVVRRVELDYHTPARLDDLLQVTVQVTEQRGASLRLKQRIRREGTSTPLVEAMVRIACVDAGLRPARLPEHMLAALAASPKVET